MTFMLSQSAAMVDSAMQLYEMFGKNTPLIFAVLPSMIAVGIFLGVRKSSNTIVKLLPYIPLVVGIFLGGVAYFLMADTVYMAAYPPGPRTAMIFRAVPIIPILVGIGFFVYNKMSSRTIDSNL